MTGVFTPTASGDLRIDALLGPQAWAAPGDGTPLTLTYGFPGPGSIWSSEPDAYGASGSAEPWTGFAALEDAQRQAVREALAAWAAVANAEGGIGDVMAGCQWVSEQAKWLSEAIFPKLMEIYLVSLGRSPRLADIGGSVAGWWQSLHEATA